MDTKTKISRKEIARKINPSIFPNVGGKLWSILGYILRKKWTNPHFMELTASCEGFIFGARSSDAQSVFIAGRSEVERNIRGICGATFAQPDEADRVTPEEVEWMVNQIPQPMRPR